MRKRYLSLMLAGILLGVQLCGCGGGDTASSASEDGDTIELTFWYGLSGGPGEELQGIIDEYNESQDKVFVNAQFQGSYEETLNKLKTAVRTQNGPDLVQIYEAGTRTMIDSGFCIPMQEIIDDYDIDISKLEENILAYYTIDNKLYSMPLNTSIPVCFYNKTVLSQIGYEDGPKSWEDILDISQKVIEEGLASAGFAMNNTIWCFEQPMVQQHYAMVDQDNGREGRATKTVFADGDVALEVVSMLGEIYDKGYGADVGFTGDANKAAFCAGDAVVTCDSSGALKSMLDTINGAYELGVCEFPPLTEDSDNGGVTLGGASIYACDNDRGDSVNEAIADFIKYMISPEVQGEFSVNTGYFPVTTEAYEQEVVKKNMEEYPQYQVITDALHKSVNMGYGPLYASIIECRTVYQKYLEQVMMGNLEPEECVAKCAKEADAIIADYNAANPME